MTALNGKIRTDASSATNTAHALTLSTLVEVNMAKASLPNSNSKSKICSISGCERPRSARGWCATHYARWQRCGDPLPHEPIAQQPYIATDICTADGCTKRPVARNLCGTHHARWRKHGDPNYLAIRRGAGTTFFLRFWSRVSITADPTRCWEWQGRPSDQGYGYVTIGQKRRGAHRIAWLLTYGVLPANWILHTCDNRLCVNPSHLYDGTPKENARDMIERGRAWWQKGCQLEAI